MKINVYNQEGKEMGDALLPKEIFDLEVNKDLVFQVVTSQMSNQRMVIAHTKTRGEVRGGGKKPWRQKGTGRARHGSIRSPLWRGGGTVFGPNKERNYKQKINKKMQRQALFMALTSKAKDNELFVLEDFKLEQIKTKNVAAILKILPQKGSCLIALPENSEIVRAIRNIPNVDVKEARNLNAFDVLNHKYLLMPKESIDVIKETFEKR